MPAQREVIDVLAIPTIEQPGFEAVPLGLRANLAMDVKTRDSVSRNVIGLLPGKGRLADQYAP